MHLFNNPCRLARVALAVAVGASITSASAAELAFPNRPVRVVIGFPAGGAIDALARLLGPKLADATGQNWVVDNRAGAGGNLASETVARATPDGHTLLLALDTQLTANPSLYRLPFNVQADLQPVTMLAKFENILLVSPGVPATSLAEFVALAKQRPGALNYGSSGVGSTLHLTAEVLKKRAAINLVHVPYKGSAPAFAALLAGETQMMVGAIPSSIGHVRAGRLRALATTGSRRNAVTPELPTVAESGYPGFESIAWFAFLAPAGTPASAVHRIRTEVAAALQHADVRATMSRLGLEPQTSTQEELASRIRAETEVSAEIIRNSGVRPE